MKNRARISINTQVLAEIFTVGWNGDNVRCIDGLPDGAEFVNMAYEPMTDMFVLVFEHESFAPSRPGEMLPVIYPVYQYNTPK